MRRYTVYCFRLVVKPLDSRNYSSFTSTSVDRCHRSTLAAHTILIYSCTPAHLAPTRTTANTHRTLRSTSLSRALRTSTDPHEPYEPSTASYLRYLGYLH